MRWITANQLEAWARSPAARTDLPKIVSDLIRASSPDIAAIRFPSGDKGQVRGFDGYLDASTASLNVPDGRSYWEFGTNADYKAKALGDFAKRTKETPEAEQARTTFVFVSPWTWDSSNADNKIEDWLRARRAEGAWKDVLYIDGVSLQTWLEEHPAVGAWHARNTLGEKPLEGVRSTDDFWDEFTGQFGPRLTEDVLLCERNEAAKRLVDALSGPPTTLTYVADSPDEMVAFTIAAIRRSDPETRLFLEARTLVVDSSAAGRQLLANHDLVLLLRGDAGRSPAQFAVVGSILVALGRQQRGGGTPVLPRQTGQALGAAIRTMGFPENEAITLARGSGGSLAALARLKPSGYWAPPAWREHGHALLPTILAGAWNATNDEDRRLLEALSGGTAYTDIEANLRRFLNDSDPPFDLEGRVFKVRAPMDAFIHVGELIGEAQAERLRAAMINVFGFVDDEDPDDRGVVFRRGPEPGYSEWLREGLATTLLLIAVRSEAARVNFGVESGQMFADRTIKALPGLTSDIDLLASLQRELPLLAEAAPLPLLSALEQLLEGDAIRQIFAEKEGLVFPRARHTGLLWALEALAWDPLYFRRAVLILARLAAVDPGGKLANRPLNSLGEIFVLWNPNTNASPALRAAMLEEIAKIVPAVGWKLVKMLLPSLHGVSSPTAKPRLREGGASERPPVTNRELYDAQIGLIHMALRLVGADESRWNDLIRGVGTFPPAERKTLADQLDVVLDGADPDVRKRLWTRARDEVAQHERYASARWALPEEELVDLRAVVERHTPADPLVPVLFLFDSWALDGTGDMEASNQIRADALAALYAAYGVDAVFRLATESRHPYLAVEAIGTAGLPTDAIRILLDLSFALEPISTLTLMLTNLYRTQAGDTMARGWLNAQAASGVDRQTIGALLMAWPDQASTWALTRQFGPEAVDGYWTRRQPLYLKGPRFDLIRSTLMFLRYGRAVAALQSAFDRLADLPSSLIVRVLDRIVPELNASTSAADSMLSYYIEGALAELDKRADITPIEIAQREYNFLPLLEYGSRHLRIHALMAENAAFYHQILRDAFITTAELKARLEREAENPGAPEVVDEAKVGQARQAYTLLTHFDLIPGATPAGLDAAALTTWIDTLRALGRDTDRDAITDNYVGRVLAHAPQDSDGGWPDRVVRDQIERLASKEVDHALQIERYNMRGVHTRGVFDGGDQERALAQQAREWAAKAEAWPRTAALLAAIASGWDEDAKEHDVRAAQRKLHS